MKYIFSVLILLIATILAILTVCLPEDHLIKLISIFRFFDIMLPVLAVGALIKYLFSCNRKN